MDENGKQVETAVVRTEITPLVMLEKAVVSGADVEVLERLMALQERWQTNKARQAFTDALASARGNLPAIVKTRQVDFSSAKGRTAYRYEDLAEIIDQVAPVLAKHGLSFRWRTDSATPGFVTVTCIFSHRDGHSEETALSGPYDTSGNKNPIQAIGSCVTYLQRYTLKAALGIAAGFDDDGRQGAPMQRHEQAENENAHPASAKSIALMQKLAKSHHVSDQEREGIERRVKAGMTQDQCSKAIDWLKETIANRDKATGKAQEPRTDAPAPGDGPPSDVPPGSQPAPGEQSFLDGLDKEKEEVEK